MEVINCKVVNLRKMGYKNLEHWLENPDHIYIGRNMSFYVKGAIKSKWANPFRVGKDGSREECLEKYRHYILNSTLASELHELKGKKLACWCKPEGCHGDILIELLSV